MEIYRKMEEIKMYNLMKCNIIYFIDYEQQIKLKEKVKSESEKENIIPIFLDLKEIQEDAFKIEESIMIFLKNLNQEVSDWDIEFLKLRKNIFKSSENLIEDRKSILKMKKENTSKLLHFKNMLLHQYMVFKILESLSKYFKIEDISPEDIKNNINNLLNDITFEKLDSSKLSFDPISDLINCMKKIRIENKSFFSVICINGNYVVDNELQETVNAHMHNQRSGIMSFSVMTEDYLFHEYSGKFHLQNTHDVNRIVIDTEKYQKIVKKSI